MADNKNQHFVPRCHLKPFSVGAKGRAINLFNLDRSRVIPNAPVKHQCSGDYFYGDDKRLDDAIRFIEDGYGPVVQRLGDGAEITPGEDIVLRRFIYLQHLRTEAASRKAAEMVQSMFTMPGVEAQSLNFKEEMRDAVINSMLVYAESMRIVDDLKLRIVRNRTEVRFVTSDDPAILTNRWHLQRNQPSARGFGPTSAGTIFVMPLSPDLCCILHDGDVYSVPHRRGWVDLENPADAEALNEHQFLGCHANIYFREWTDREEVSSAMERCRPRRLQDSHTVTHAVLDEETEWGKRYAVKPLADIASGDEVMVHVMRNTPAPSAWPSFLRFRSDRKAHSNNSGTGYVRRGSVEQGFASGTGYRRVRI